MNKKSELVGLLKGMNVPKNRCDLDNYENIVWLAQNLPIDNLDNKNLGRAMTLVNELGKEGISMFFNKFAKGLF